MANNHATLTALFTDIADAIRAKTGKTGKIVADNFPSEIAAIQAGGGSADEKTCTIKFNGWSSYFTSVKYLAFEDGSLIIKRITSNIPDDLMLENVVCNTVIVLEKSMNASIETGGNCALLQTGAVYLLYQTAANGSTLTLPVNYVDF